MGKVTEIKHPLILHKLSMIRDKNTGAKNFRELVEEVSMLMAYEATRDLQTKEVEIETPICKTKCCVLAGKKVAVVPILRAGLGMVNGIINLIPAAKIGHIGLYRDEETLKPVEYFCKLQTIVFNRLFKLNDIITSFMIIIAIILKVLLVCNNVLVKVINNDFEALFSSHSFVLLKHK